MNKLKFYRLERGLSQVELMEATGVPRWSIQLIEGCHRAPTEDEITALSATLGVSKLELFPKPQSSAAKNRQYLDRKGV